MDVYLRRELLRRWRQHRIRTIYRMTRESSDPLALDDLLFRKNYRVSKETFMFLCGTLETRLRVPQRSHHIPAALKILSTLNFLATGSYQKPIGHDWLAPLSQASVSQSINDVVEALNEMLSTFIKFPRNRDERLKIQQGFYNKYGMPGVIGCIDGTLIAIVAPRCDPNEAAFFSRKGYHALNTAIICDSKLSIIGINARFGGAAHDSYVCNNWPISQHLQELHSSGESCWLLGDSGYPQRPWLMTPALHAAEGTPEAYYTDMHVRTRVCVERCIGLLKARWRCLLRHRVLHYTPEKCAKIINACAVLHNICNTAQEDSSNSDLQYNEPVATGSRQELINLIWLNAHAN